MAIPHASTNPRGDRLRAAREAVGIRSCKALAESIDTRGFGYGKLSRIEAGIDSLAPQDADYIAKHLGIPSSFFTAPLGALGDVRAGAEAIVATPSSPVAAAASDADDVLDQLDELLDRQADGEGPHPQGTDTESPRRTGTQQ